MITFKCKMCGGDLNFEQGASIAKCPYCGTMQTLPKLSDDRRVNMYERANHFRRQNEYDKAMNIYEQILQENASDAEVYWSLVLCRFGIEYVEDPSTHDRIPTVNRTQYFSILVDEDYKSALKYADAEQRIIYESEAKTIDEIQKSILLISNKEEPFDVFICYKETDMNGRRTPDSVLANDIYHQLSNEGFKVFFSRITLEDKLGYQYEPYIFAALNSAKVMLVIGTKPEYFNAVWVKNEWKRYLTLIRDDRSRLLIPCYRDMDPYDLPEEFSTLQSQDMSKIGFLQDILHGVKKYFLEESENTMQSVENVGIGDEPFAEKMAKMLNAQLSVYMNDMNEKKGDIRVLEIEMAQTKGMFKKKSRMEIQERINRIKTEIETVNKKTDVTSGLLNTVESFPNEAGRWIDYITGKIEDNKVVPPSISELKETRKMENDRRNHITLIVILVGIFLFLTISSIIILIKGN